MPKIEKDLKDAIVGMPEKEKDRLLLRLVAKDDMLIKKLQHQLLEDDFDMEERRGKLKEQIKTAMEMESTYFYNHTPGLLMMQMRDMNGKITRHVKITKDKYGEVELTLLLLTSTIEKHRKMLGEYEYSAARTETFSRYFCRRTVFVMNKLKRMNRDLYIEFEDQVNAILEFIHSYHPTSFENSDHQLPKKWTY